MEKKKYWLIRLFYVLFTVSVSLTVLPCGIVNARGQFGEITASAAVENTNGPAQRTAQEVRRQRESAAKQQTVQVVRTLLFNLWLVILAQILYQRFREYPVRLPRGDTIVTLKVRMDD